ncbi:YceI family protein [bacterium]|nr:YceI family protein [bacterium]
MPSVSTIGRSVAAAALLLAAFTVPEDARAERWVVSSGEGQLVGFHSKAPMESFDGTTHDVSGFVELDPAAIGDSLALGIRVDMASLDTGISMRNRHMRDNHLHTDRFPEAAFRGGRVTAGAGTDLRDGATHAVTVEGELELHGVTRPVTVELRLTLGGGGADAEEAAASLRVEADFPVALSDHDIPRPRFLFAKLGEVQRVYAKVTGTVATAQGDTTTGS